jgi:NAD(P)H-dependent FMN reductase
MNRPVAILDFAGSLRKNPYNKALLRAAMRALKEDGNNRGFH